MKQRTLTLILPALVAGLLLTACGSNDKAPGGGDKQNTASANALPSWLPGRWQVTLASQANAGEAAVQVEEWHRFNDSTYIGRTYLVEGRDTTFGEAVRMEAFHNALLYTATVPDQNGNRPVIFARQGSGDSAYTFVNEKHDFPQRITYRRVGADSVVAIVEGKDEQGAQQRQEIPMRRLK